MSASTMHASEKGSAAHLDPKSSYCLSSDYQMNGRQGQSFWIDMRLLGEKS